MFESPCLFEPTFLIREIYIVFINDRPFFVEEVSDWTAIAHLAEARNQISRIRHFGHALFAVSFLWDGFLHITFVMNVSCRQEQAFDSAHTGFRYDGQ